MIVKIGAGLTANVSVWLAVPKALMAESVIVLIPGVVGLPEITPVSELRLKPTGRPVAVNWVGALLAVMVWLKSCPTVADAVAELVMTGAGIELTVNVSVWLAVP